MHVTTAVKKFLRQLEADGRSPHTAGQYRRHLRLFAAWAADVGHSGRLSAIGHETVARFLTSRHARTSAHQGKKLKLLSKQDDGDLGWSRRRYAQGREVGLRSEFLYSVVNR